MLPVRSEMASNPVGVMVSSPNSRNGLPLRPSMLAMDVILNVFCIVTMLDAERCREGIWFFWLKLGRWNASLRRIR